MSFEQELIELKQKGQAPAWMDVTGYTMLKGGYLAEGKTPRDMYKNIAHFAQKYHTQMVEKRNAESSTKFNQPFQFEEELFLALWNNYICPASPVLSNFGSQRGFPISCFGVDVDDSLYGIASANSELMYLTNGGGGVGINLSNVRGRGENIGKGDKYIGQSNGIVPWAKIFDSSIIATNQGSVRRGAASVNLHIDHPDFYEFMQIRRAEGDVNRQCLNLNQCVVIPDSFMHKVYNKDPEALKKWSIILKTRMEKGQPYIMYEDNVNRKNPKSYEKFGEKVSFTNICTEITLATKPGESSFVCCLSSLNFALYDIWSKINQPFSIPQLAVLLLDSVLEEFIEKTEKASESSYDKRELNRARKNAIESRAIGIGVLGYHTYLQRKMIPIDSLYARNVRYNALKYIQDEANTMSKLLGQMISVPKLADNRRHSHLTAIAPTVTNAHISGGVSPSIEPWPSNYYTLKTAKGTFFKKNEELDAYLKSLNLGEEQYKTLWDIIKKDEGSVVNVPEKIIPKEIKDVFKTFQEVNQLALVEHTAFCVDLVDQATSLNLCFSPNEKASTVSLVHKTAWQMGVKTLYYLRTGSAIRGDNLHNNGCSSCEA